MSFDLSSQVGVVSNSSPNYHSPTLPCSQIRKDGGTQIRVIQNQLVIDDYAEKMIAGAVFPPVVVFFDGLEYWLADGFHRVNAAIQAGIEHINVDVKEGDKRDALLYAVGANSSHGLRRTNEDKRNAVLLLLNDPEWREWSNVEIAKACAVSHTFVNNLRSSLETVSSEKSERTYTTKHGTVARMNTERIGSTSKIDPGVRDLIRNTPMADRPDDLVRLSSFEPEQQKRIADVIVSGEADTINHAKKILAAENVKSVELPEGKYRVIYADPPWQYGGCMNPDAGMAADLQYPTMPLDEIAALPVADLAADNAVLFLWTTSPLLQDSFTIINAWGFQYKASFVWDKVKHNFGYYNSVRHEFLLVCTKGSCTPDNSKLYDSVQSIERTEHSKKPEEFRQIIDDLYPSGPRIELFAREPADNWQSWGNQV